MTRWNSHPIICRLGFVEDDNLRQLLQADVERLLTELEHLREGAKRGGQRGGPARAAKLSAERRSEIARMGAFAKQAKAKSS